MKTNKLLLVFSVLLIFTSCRKDKTVPLNEDDSNLEIINSKMSETENSFFCEMTFFKDTRGGDMYHGTKSWYSWQLNYRLANGQQNGDLAFYRVEKSWEVKARFYESNNSIVGETYDEWEHKQEWGETNRYYRYDATNLRSYIHNGMDDENPSLIMDFNLEIDEEWFFGDENEFRLKVINKFDVTSDGLTYPALIVKFYSNENDQDYLSNGQSLLSPLNPNPILMGDNVNRIGVPDWSVFQVNNEPQPADHWISRDVPYEKGHVRIKWNTAGFENYPHAYSKEGGARYYLNGFY